MMHICQVLQLDHHWFFFNFLVRDSILRNDIMFPQKGKVIYFKSQVLSIGLWQLGPRSVPRKWNNAPFRILIAFKKLVQGQHQRITKHGTWSIKSIWRAWCANLYLLQPPSDASTTQMARFICSNGPTIRKTCGLYLPFLPKRIPPHTFWALPCLGLITGEQKRALLKNKHIFRSNQRVGRLIQHGDRT